MTRSPLFLIGFMGAGKSTVGRLVAARGRRPFVDLDEEITRRTGCAVTALITADEASFRRLEARTLAELISNAQPEWVIATGGGAAVHGDNLDRMRRAGLVVTLDVSLATARARCEAEGGRPLLSRPPSQVDELLRQRQPYYRRAHAVVDTETGRVDDVATRVILAEAAYQSVAGRRATIVALEHEAYPVVIADAAFDGDLVRARLAEETKRLALLTDHQVGAFWSEAATSALVRAGFDVDVTMVPAGEASKSLATYQEVADHLAPRLDRSGAIIALGGGVVGDLAGFVAATLFRGVPVIQWPTSLVAMVDAAIGGKTAVDLPAGKNLLGAFWQPRLVACHLPVLATLPPRERRAAFGELWKYALLDGEDTWDLVEDHAEWARADGAAAPSTVGDVVEAAVRYKAALVARDERERKGQRILLNLGHTVGHAIETEAAGALLHGECVALGLLAACRVGEALGTTPADLTRRVAEALALSGLDTDLGPWLTPSVLARVAVDKKRVGDDVRFVVAAEPGRCEVVHLPRATLAKILLPSKGL